MKKIGIGLIAISIFAPAFGGIVDLNVTVDLKLGISNCYGAYSHCDVTIGGVGEVFDKDINLGPKIQLGQIKDEVEKNISLPTEKDTMITYTFMPTTGELAGEFIRVTLYNKDPGRSRQAGKNVIKLYRRLSNEKYSIEGGELESAKPFAQLKFALEPDGTWKAWDPRTKEEVDFLFGKKDMRPTKTTPEPIGPAIKG